MHSAWFFCYRPAGWDSMKKISILYDNMQTIRPDEFYNSVITKVNTRKVCIVWNFTQTFCFINHLFFFRLLLKIMKSKQKMNKYF